MKPAFIVQVTDSPAFLRAKWTAKPPSLKLAIVARRAIPLTLRMIHRRAWMAHRSSFAEMKAEQAKMTASWKAEGRTSEAWAIADPEIVEIFSAGVVFGIDAGRRNRRDPAYTPDEWRKALREAVEKAAALEAKLEKAKEAMATKPKE